MVTRLIGVRPNLQSPLGDWRPGQGARVPQHAGYGDPVQGSEVPKQAGLGLQAPTQGPHPGLGVASQRAPARLRQAVQEPIAPWWGDAAGPYLGISQGRSPGEFPDAGNNLG